MGWEWSLATPILSFLLFSSWFCHPRSVHSVPTPPPPDLSKSGYRWTPPPHRSGELVIIRAPLLSSEALTLIESASTTQHDIISDVTSGRGEAGCFLFVIMTGSWTGSFPDSCQTLLGCSERSVLFHICYAPPHLAHTHTHT